MVTKNATQKKLRPGTTFVSKRTGNLKYADADGAVCWLVPMSRYYANGVILRGQPVAVCDATQLQGATAEDPYAYVKPFDPNEDTFCVGVATNYATAGDIVTVQRSGKFEYLTTKSTKYLAGDRKEIYINMNSAGWMFDAVHGQTVYLKASAQGYDNGHDSVGAVVDTNNTLTYDFIDSVYSSKSTVQLGHFVDAPNTDDGTQPVVLELDVTGDVRGPIDNTQHVVTLGEDVDFTDNQLKVIALVNPEGEAASVYYKMLTTDGATRLPDNAWISIKKNGEYTLISASQSITTEGVDQQHMAILPSTVSRKYATTVSALQSAILETLQCGDPTPLADGGSIYTSTTTEDCVIYVSQNLRRYVTLKVLNPGFPAHTAGTAVVADIRSKYRSVVLGIALPDGSTSKQAGDTIKVLRQGKIVTNGLEPGAEYFLGKNGAIVKDGLQGFDTKIRIGIAENDKNLLVDIAQKQTDYSGTIPLGYIKPCMPGNIAEYGYLIMDGATRLNVVDYQDIYDYITSFYSAEELKVETVDGNTTFVLPLVLMDVGNNIGDDNRLAQIKYLKSGLFTDTIPRVPFIRTMGVFSTNNKVADVNVSKLIQYGPLEESEFVPTLDNIDIKLYYLDEQDMRPGEFANKSWREVPPGFHVYNNDDLYGYEWLVSQDSDDPAGAYTLKMNTANGAGPCTFKAHARPLPLIGKAYKIVITAKNLWTREYSLLEEQTVATRMDNYNSDVVAPSVNAVKEYIQHHMAHQTIDVIDITTGAVKNLTVDNLTITGKELVFKPDFDDHVNAKATAYFDDQNRRVEAVEVHGLLNAGKDGNIDAKALQGMDVGGQNIPATTSYIQFVEVTANESKTRTGTTTEHKDTNGQTLVTDTIKKMTEYPSGTSVLEFKTTVEQDIPSIRYVQHFGATTLSEHILVRPDDRIIIKFEDTVTQAENHIPIYLEGVHFDSIVLGSYTITPSDWMTVIGGSSIAYKENIKEFINSDLKTFADTLNALDDYDNTGHKLTNAEKVLSTITAIQGYGEALQALYELPLATYTYKAIEDKEQLGILVERVEQIKDAINTTLGHSIYNSQGVQYTYTQEEINSIKKYLDLVTTKKQLGQSIKSTVGILLKAAQESQERLLQLESSVFGSDAKTIPGNKAGRATAVESALDGDLESIITNNPTFLGLNRLIRALCLEVFNTADLDQISKEHAAEQLEGSLTIASRLDEIERIIEENRATIKGITDSISEAFIQHTTDVATIQESVTRGTFDTVPTITEHISNNYGYDAVYEGGVDRAVKEVQYHTYSIDSEGHIQSREAASLSLDDKIERLNKKVSAITEVLYGDDEVCHDPNVISTIKRNIENLIKDLYPNVEDIEHVRVSEDGEASTMLLPFNRTIDGSKDAHGGYNPEDISSDEGDLTYKPSILPILTQQIYSFSEPVPYGFTKTVDQAAVDTEIIEFDVKGMKAEDIKNSNPTSRFDYIEQALGVEYTYPFAYTDEGALERLFRKETNAYQLLQPMDLLDGNYLTAYGKELKYGTVRIEDDGTSIEKLIQQANYTTKAAAYSRKDKSLAARVTSIEAALDDIIFLLSNVAKEETLADNKLRFEDGIAFKSSSSIENLNRYLHSQDTAVSNITYVPMIEDILAYSPASVMAHNLTVLTNLMKSGRTIVRIDPYADTRIVTLSEGTIFIKYYSNTIPTQRADDTIYLKKVATPSNVFNTLAEDTFNEATWLDSTSSQTSYQNATILHLLAKGVKDSINSPDIKLTGQELEDSSNSYHRVSALTGTTLEPVDAAYGFEPPSLFLYKKNVSGQVPHYSIKEYESAPYTSSRSAQRTLGYVTKEHSANIVTLTEGTTTMVGAKDNWEVPFEAGKTYYKKPSGDNAEKVLFSNNSLKAAMGFDECADVYCVGNNNSPITLDGLKALFINTVQYRTWVLPRTGGQDPEVLIYPLSWYSSGNTLVAFAGSIQTPVITVTVNTNTITVEAVGTFERVLA